MQHLRADPSDRGWLRIGAVAIGGLAIAQVLAAVVLAPVAGFSWSRALTSFLATNGLMGAAFATSGLVIAWYRPRNPLGWLLVAGGLGHATSALMAPIAQLLHDHGAPLPVLRVVLTVFMFAWPWSIALFLPMSLLLFPDGHLPSPRWRYAAWAIVLTAPLFVVEMVTGTEPVSEGMPLGYFTFDTGDALNWLWSIAEVRTSGALLLAVVSLVVRYRRAGETERAQLLWLLMAGLVVIAAVAPWSFVAGTPIAVLFAIPLVPLAITVAVVRHQLLDIRLVVSRVVAWLLLSVAALVAYVAVVTLLDSFVSQAFGRSAFATVLVAVALAPLLPRLQREVDRWMYGDRRDPARVAGRLGAVLAAGDERGLPEWPRHCARRCDSPMSGSATLAPSWPRTASPRPASRYCRWSTPARLSASSRSVFVLASSDSPALTRPRCSSLPHLWPWPSVRSPCPLTSSSRRPGSS